MPNVRTAKEELDLFAQARAINELEHRPLDSYENHLLLLRTLGTKSQKQCKDAFMIYMNDGVKTL